MSERDDGAMLTPAEMAALQRGRGHLAAAAPLRIWDARAEVYRDATQSDLDLAEDRVVALMQFRDEVRALTREIDERLALLIRKHATP